MADILGVVGNKQHGKDTIGRLLYSYHGYTRIAFADELKYYVHDIFSVPFHNLYGTEEQKNEVLPHLGMSGRRACQILGTEVGRAISKTVWVNRVVSAIRGDTPIRIPVTQVHPEKPKRFFITLDPSVQRKWVVTDVRYQNEADELRKVAKELGKTCVIIRVVRPEVEVDLSHTSERELQNIDVDDWVHNDGTVEDLHQILKRKLALE